ncbi:MAG TPA: SPOR domain-containing protein [Sphingobium sp.]|uniref:tetratricopeptide repeat protein n=1 Tax=Sphingobium sp. TaxID=1912891 RepID=UPI002ED64E56
MKAVLGLSVAVSLLTLAAPVAAQTGAIVQSTPSSLAVERLNQNLNRLSRQPTDMEALIGAGMASYELGDAQAANGFFTRANMVNARDGRAKLGLALVSLALKQPREAAAYFDDAEGLGVRADQYLTERALAYDLTGQQEKAQRDYAIALQRTPGNAELIRAYAVSLGISGKVDQAELQLRPLLFKSDRAAWRDRTMILAMNGRTAEARRIAQTIMPRNLSDAMDPYLLRMGSLNAAQKAAAVHYGQFPAEGLRLATVTSPPAAAQAAARAEGASRRTTRDRRKPVAEQAAAPSEDSSLLAAMPRGDAPPAMVQAIPSSTPQPTMATPVSRASNAADDDPDGLTLQEQQQLARRTRTATRTATVQETQPIESPVRTAETPVGIRTGRTPNYATTTGRSRATVQPVPSVVQPVQTVQSVPGATQPVQTVQSIPQASQAVSAPSPATPVQGATPAGTALASASVQPAVPAQRPPASIAPAPVQSVLSQPMPAPTEPQPGFSVAPATGAAPVVTRQRTLADIMAGIEVPESERVAPPQLVDLNEVAQIQAAKHKAAAEKAKKDAAAKAKAEADAKAKAEAKAEAEEKARLKANPARIWVQVATGKETAALAFDMRRLRKTYSVLAGEDAFTAEWGATRRLLVGPFLTQTKAKALLTDLKKAGNDGFVYQSEAGEVVTALSGK